MYEKKIISNIIEDENENARARVVFTRLGGERPRETFNDLVRRPRRVARPTHGRPRHGTAREVDSRARV